MTSSATDADGKRGSRHERHGSGKASLVRQTTKGPLDHDEPLATNHPLSPQISSSRLTPSQSQLLSPTALTSSQSQFATQSRQHSPSPLHKASPRLPSPQPSNLSSNTSFKTAHSTLSTMYPTLTPAKDFSYLLRPEIYHPLSQLDVPPPFRISSLQPDPATPLPELVAQGHFRSAAIKAAQLLTSSGIASSDYKHIFDLVYTRLSCLTLCGQSKLASQEVKALEDLNNTYYVDQESGVHLVPWELRVFAVRLQAIGFNDARRGVMGYYDLARDARLILTTLKKSLTEALERSEEVAIWETRLQELGLAVASALIEMEDLNDAARHLKSLSPIPSASRDLALQKALLWLLIGDIDAAKTCVSSSEAHNIRNNKMIQALGFIADSDPASSVPIWEELITSHAEDAAMYRQNLAVCHLYLGQMSSARTVFEELIDNGHNFHALTFNLSTLYELCTERGRSLKIGLAERVAETVRGTAARHKDEYGWEKINSDFKL
ncbi:hypothetical protein BJ878DRAFT_491857 [Calycina marina]|uniref:Tetratricopeptide repeat protein 15 n=1 Tax=Calycina marina TaxID=1763456 RepID=A0A9P8CHT2_9HELO|nr:hypothetical protein BJ878DRAFT_491857 [Calycina marina]